MSNEIIQHENNQQVSNILSISQLTERVKLVKQALQAVMIQNEHYGIIPGCGSKPTLLKAGAEKLCMLFRLAPTFEIKVRELEQGHREYEIITTLRNIPTGEMWAQGVGCCSTMETKYRYRTIYKGNEKIKIENENIVDVYNTVLKMAKKRSQADAVLTATGASDIFTQDLEDLPDHLKKDIKPKVQVAPKEPIKYNELQLNHKAVYLSHVGLIKKAGNEEEANAIYENAKDTFSASTSLTKECIDKTIEALKFVYESKIEELKDWKDEQPINNGDTILNPAP